MSLPAIILKVLNLLNKEGIKAEVTPMYGSCNTRYVITLPGVKIDNTKPQTASAEKSKVPQH